MLLNYRVNSNETIIKLIKNVINFWNNFRVIYVLMKDFVKINAKFLEKFGAIYENWEESAGKLQSNFRKMIMELSNNFREILEKRLVNFKNIWRNFGSLIKEFRILKKFWGNFKII